VHRGDGGIGAMSLGLGRDLEDEDRPAKAPRHATSGIAQGRAKWADAALPPSPAGVGTVYPAITPKTDGSSPVVPRRR